MSAAERYQPLSDALRDNTKSIHTKAEKSGFIQDLIKGQVSIHGYRLFLANLLHVYESLEHELQTHTTHDSIALLNSASVFRANSIREDLKHLAYDHPDSKLPLLASTIKYADHLRTISNGHSELLIAHFYVRYLGDLNGGQVLAKRLSLSLHLTPEQLSFYRFENVPNIRKKISEVRSALDSCGKISNDSDLVINEAVLAFQMNIDLSIDVKTYLQ